MEKIELTDERYENLWHLIRSRSDEDLTLAIMSIMNIDWNKDNVLLLEFLILDRVGRLRNRNLPKIPGWVAFTKKYPLNYWSKYNPDFKDLQRLFGKYQVTEQQVKLIYKLLNN